MIYLIKIAIFDTGDLKIEEVTLVASTFGQPLRYGLIKKKRRELLKYRLS